jgi:hypothetical protein
MIAFLLSTYDAASQVVSMIDSFTSFTRVGLQAVGGSAINVSDTEVTQSATGLNANGGTLASLQENSVFSNTVADAFNSTTGKQ